MKMLVIRKYLYPKYVLIWGDDLNRSNDLSFDI